MQENDNFSFINEKIKEKPVKKKKLLFRAGFTVAMAVLFGVVASLVFAFFQPVFQKMLYPGEDSVVTIPKDSIDTTEETENVAETEAAGEGTEEGNPSAGAEPLQAEETEAQQPENAGEETEPLPDGALPPEEQAPVAPEMELADYQQLQNKLYAVGREANKFVVTVTGVKSDTDWFNNAYENRGSGSGIIIMENGRELLILTERKVISDVEEIYVTFINEYTAEASMKKYDGNTGIAVLSVPRENIDEETLGQIDVATLGNSLVTTQGMIALAVGSPLGANYSILTGSITSTTNSITTVDANYTVFTTDIVGDSNGSGAIINVEGEVVGLVMQDYSSAGDRSTLTAISISELKTVIEMLSNNQDIPYIGLELSTVTNDIAREYDIPKGAYIKEVLMDSPAMAAGLQSGDVITSMGGDAIFNVDGYEAKLLSLEPGESVDVVVQRQGAGGYAEITCTAEVSVLW